MEDAGAEQTEEDNSGEEEGEGEVGWVVLLAVDTEVGG